MTYTPYGAPAGFDWITRLESWRVEHNTLHLSGRTAADQVAQIALMAVSPHVWRLTMTIPGAQAQTPTPILVTPPPPPPPPAAVMPLEVQVAGETLCVAGAELLLQVDSDPFCLRFLDSSGREICRENPYDIDGLGRPFILPLGFVAGDSPLITETFHLRQDEHLFGLGEKFTPLDKRGQRIISWTQDAFGSTSERSHKNIPFLMSTRGYGLLLDTGARITWDLGTVSCQSYTMQVEGTTLDAYLIYGPSPAEILQRYTDLTGHAPVPPRWSFGLWLSGSGSYRDRASIERLAEGAEARDLPVDVIHVDTWWMKWRNYADYRFDPDSFPDVETFIGGLHDKGLRLSLWEQPYISIESDRFETGKANDYFLKRPDGEIYVIDYGLSLAPRPDGTVRIATPETSWNARVAMVDMTNPKAVAWYQDMHRPLLQMGVDVFKTDFGEDIPRDAVFSDGQTGETMHNLYPLIYNQAVSDVVRQEKGYSLVWGRSGTAGSQRYPVCWSGDPAADWDSLACTIRGGLSIGQSGIPFWSSDIGGYRGMPTPDLYVRWAQFTLFCSHARMHGDSQREPWFFGDDAFRIVRDYVSLRYRLFPYVYSAAHEASRTGMPVIRAMSLAFPDDPNTYTQDLQYMFGPSLLVAPIYDPSGERSVYLPDGAWIDFHSGNVYRGQTTIHVHAPLDRMPIFVRGGVVIPQIEPVRRIPQGSPERLIVDVYPHGSTQYTLLDDDAETTFETRDDGERLTLRWQGSVAQTLVIRFRTSGGGNPVLDGGTPDQISVDGSDIIIHGLVQGSVTVQRRI